MGESSIDWPTQDPQPQRAALILVTALGLLRWEPGKIMLADDESQVTISHCRTKLGMTLRQATWPLASLALLRQLWES